MHSTPLVLSCFPGIGLLDMAFEEEGFCVVRGPDLLWGGDIRRFHPPAGRFDGVIGGPPCQAFSPLRKLVEHNGFEVAANMIPDFERVIGEAAPSWFLMENVEGAPLPIVPGYVVRSMLVDNRHDCGGEQSRVRRFSFGTKDGRVLSLEWPPPPVPMAWRPAALASGGGESKRNGKTGGGKIRKWRKGAGTMGYKTREVFVDHLASQGLPPDFDLPPFTVAAKVKAIGNGVPLMMGGAIARAVKRSIYGATG